MPKKSRNSIRYRLLWFAFGILAVGAAHAGDIKPSVEVEFNLFYNRNFPQPLSFQFREVKLFLDAEISDRSTALIEYTMKDNLVRAQVERAYFVQHDLPWNSQLTLGQIRNPFGFYDPFTVSHSLTKNTPMTPDPAMPAFQLRDIDVGLYWESRGENVTVGLGVVNGNGVNSLKDDNNFKDIIGHAVVPVGPVQFGVNGYYGRKNSLNGDGSVRNYSAVEVSAWGVEALAFVGDATIAWEAVQRNYGPLHGAGTYVTMNYDLSSFVPTLRTTSRMEYYDPNTRTPNDESIQWAQGLLYTLSRGYLAKLEFVVDLEHHRRQSPEIFFELEYEL